MKPAEYKLSCSKVLLESRDIEEKRERVIDHFHL